ncbi:MAG: MerR family transcriptional regulator [Oscillospiraceae bacterium]|nr:MerR family transcriptional regulator [Oscillospiraceae bacterium]
MTIAEVSRKYDLTPDTLRYYERVGLIPAVPRTPGGQRDYGEEECRWVEFIKCMRAAGLPVETLIRYVALFQQGDATREERLQILVEQRALLKKRLIAMEETIARLDRKIEHYEQWTPCIEHKLGV